MLEQFKFINKDREYVKQLQEEVGAIVDGVYGPATHAAAREYYAMPIMFHMGKSLHIKISIINRIILPYKNKILVW